MYIHLGVRYPKPAANMCPYLFHEPREKTGIQVFFVCLSQVDEEPDPISLGVCGVGQPPQGLKRKADTPLGSPPEPGQVLQQQDDDGRGARFKIRVTHCPDMTFDLTLWCLQSC